MAKIRPETQREQQVVKSLGDTGWTVLNRQDKVACFDNTPGVFVEKNGHKRWMKPEQVMEEDNG